MRQQNNTVKEHNTSAHLAKSYMTVGGNISATTMHPQRNMKSSNSAGSILSKKASSSCSLGPKSELKQPEQVVAEQTLKIYDFKKLAISSSQRSSREATIFS